jgi:23S rRNA (cytidine1920-2'-O)/16S rRNA (cytidine1409-2'-O)-methyltransferase
MVKPQFEVGRRRLGAGGVVREPELRLAALREVVAAAGELGWAARGAVASPAPGPAGNVEYFLWLSSRPAADVLTGDDVDAMLEQAVREGPR